MATSEALKILLSSADNINSRIFSKYRLLILRSYKSALKEIRALIAELYAKAGDKLSYAEMLKFNRLTKIEDQIKEILDKANVKYKRDTTLAIKETYKNSYYQSGYAAEKKAGLDFGFHTLSEKKIEAAILNKMDRITWIKRSTEHGKKLNQTIREKIASGLIQGKSYNAITADIKDAIGRTTSQLMRVVQTETHRVQSMASVEAFEKIKSKGDEYGLETKKIWVATLDNKTRDTHAELDGQVADDNGMFKINGLEAEAPGLFGVAEEDINCRCTIAYEIDGITPQLRKDNETGETIKWQSYKQWAESKNIK